MPKKNVAIQNTDKASNLIYVYRKILATLMEAGEGYGGKIKQNHNRQKLSNVHRVSSNLFKID